MQIEILTDLEWDSQLKGSFHRTVFHTAKWQNWVSLAFDRKVTLCKLKNSPLKGRDSPLRKGAASSLAQKNDSSAYSALNGRDCASSCPFKDRQNSWLIPLYLSENQFRFSFIGYGGPIPLFQIVDSREILEEIREIVLFFEQHLGMKCSGYVTFPLDSWEAAPLKKGEFLSHTQVIPLGSDSHTVFENTLDGNVRTAIRRAIKGGVQVRKIKKCEIEKAYQLLVATQKLVGANYTTPFPFFKLLADSAGDGVEIWAGFGKEGEISAMSLMLYDDTSAFHLFNGWDRDRSEAGTNQLILWEMIQSSIRFGLKQFNMGESHQESLKKAKGRWGSYLSPILKGNFV